MSHIQESTVKAAIAVTKCTEQLIKNNARNEGFDLQMRGVTDALALLGNASYEMSLMRRTLLKPALNQEYAELCSPQVPITAWLFGNDFNEQLKITKKTSEIGSLLTHKTSNSHRPYKKNTHKAYRYKPYHNNSRKKYLLGNGSRGKPRKKEGRLPTLPARASIIEELTKIKKQVNKFTAFVPSLRQYLQNKCNSFKAGELKHHVNAWRKVTTDPSILESAATIEFADLPSIHGCNRLNKHFRPAESDIVSAEVGKLLAKGIIKPSQHEAGEVISGIFLRPKKDGSR